MMIINIIRRYCKPAGFSILGLALSVPAFATDQQVQQCFLDVKYKDFQRAQVSCLIAANTGDADAQLEYGSLYYFGYKEVPVDYAKTMTWISKSAAQGNPDAEHTMGEMFDFGLGVKVDKAVAFDWYEKAANQRVVGAQVNIGIMYFDGSGRAQDRVLGYAWTKVAVQRAGQMAETILDGMRPKLSEAQVSAASKQAESILEGLYPSAQ